LAGLAPFSYLHPSLHAMNSFDEKKELKPVIDSGQDKPNPSSPSREEVPSADVWIALCARAAVEQDPKKLLGLVIEINRLLDARRRLLNEDDETSEPK
jgi:hypothetical protein